MAFPYYFDPQNRTPSHYVVPQNRAPSPFFPPANLLSSSPYTSPYSSPYTGSAPLPGGSPGGVPISLPGVPNTLIHDPNPYSYGNQPSWVRPRRPSFSGTSSDEYVPSWISDMGGRNRRNSFNGGYTPYSQPSGYWSQGGNPYPPNYLNSSHLNPSLDLNPFLNGDSPQSLLSFDLSIPKFAPFGQISSGQTAWPLGAEELQEPATWPLSNRLRIECDLVPQWPILLEVNPDYFDRRNSPAVIPPITLNDVLFKIFDHFQQRITQVDWASLGPQETTDIARAYTARCKALGTTEAIERSNGVKRIDYCMGKVMFRGLTRGGNEMNGMNVLKLHLKERRRGI